MNFVFVGDTPNKALQPDDYRLRAVQLTGKTLISLISGLTQKNFGYDTVGRLTSDLKSYRQFVKEHANADVFIDSGGYSIIKGDVAPEAIDMVINCYTKVLELASDVGDYFFSLDIPFSSKHEAINTVEFIEQANRKSLEGTIKVANANLDIWDKLYFVWHFKMPQQYKIWSKLYRELGLQKKLNNYAIGGLVSLRKSANIPRAPFTAMAYRCLLDFKESGIKDKPLRLHFLGVNLPADRFQIALLETLFNDCQQGFKVICTYDSIHCAHVAQNSPAQLRWATLNAGSLEHGRLADTPEEVMVEAYPQPPMRQSFLDEIGRLSSGAKMFDGNALLPLSVATHLAEDRFFEQMAAKALPLFPKPTGAQFEQAVTAFLDDIRQASDGMFRDKFFTEMHINFRLVYELQQWWREGADRTILEGFISDQIREINFPCDLK